MLKKLVYSSKVFSDFKAINHRDSKAVIRFYHHNKANIYELHFDEAFVLQLHYAYALHALGEYERHLYEADHIIHLSIDNNIQYYQGEDVYQKTLFQKAQSYYYLEMFDEAKHIYLELIKLAPKNKRYSKALKEVLLKTEVNYIEDILLSGIFTLLFTVGFTTLYLLLSNYELAYQQFFINIIVSGFSLGLLFFTIGLVLQKTILGKKITAIRKKAIKQRKLKV